MESGDTKPVVPTPDNATNANNRTFKGRYSCLNDPKLAPSRIYIGNLSDQVQEEHLRSKFSEYGQIMGMERSQRLWSKVCHCCFFLFQIF